MRSIGAELKEARLKKGISLDFMQHKTKIRKRYFLAIEEGKVHELPGQVYVKWFIRAYAEAIDCDPKRYVSRYCQWHQSQERNASCRDEQKWKRVRQELHQGLQGALYWFGL